MLVGTCFSLLFFSGPSLCESRWAPVTSDGYAVDQNSIEQNNGIVVFWLRTSEDDTYAVQTRKRTGELREARPFLSNSWNEWQPVPPGTYLSYAIDLARISLFKPPSISSTSWIPIYGEYAVDPSQIATINGELFIYLRNLDLLPAPVLLRFREKSGVISTFVHGDGTDEWYEIEDGTVLQTIYEFALRKGDTW